MASHLSVLTAVLLVPLVASSSFDCRNTGEGPCLHGGHCHFYGICQCQPNFQGDNCGLYTPHITLNNKCSVQCQNNGTCYNGNKCYCTSDFVGDKCELPRTGLLCKYGEIEVIAYRDLSFIGETYIWNTQNCTLSNVTSDVDGMKKYSLNIRLDETTSPCMPKKTVDAVTGDITYSMDLASSYKAGEYGSRDNVQTQKCFYKAGWPGKSEDITDNKFFVKLSATDTKTGDAVHVLEENKLITLNFQAQHIKDIKDVKIDYLEIYSYNETSLEIKSKRIINNGCVNKTLEPEIGPMKSYSELKDGVYVGKIQLRSFILMNNLPLLFNYRLNFCTTMCPDPCHPPAGQLTTNTTTNATV